MAERRRIPYLLGGLVLMFVALQLLTAGISDPDQHGYLRYVALGVALVAEYLLCLIFRDSSALVKFVIGVVSLIPVFCILAVVLSFVSLPWPGFL